MKHKKLSARILSLVLTVAMVGTLLPATVFAAEGDTPVGAGATTPITRTTPLDLATNADITYIAADGSTSKTANPTIASITDTGEGWSWDLSTKTLTLDGAVIDARLTTLPSSAPDYYCGINLAIGKPVTIILNSGTENIVKVCDNPTATSAYHGIDAYNGLTINGEGSLDVEGYNYGIDIRGGAFTMNNGNVTVTSRGKDGYAIMCGSSITLTGGKLSASVANPASSISCVLSAGTDSVITATGATVTGDKDTGTTRQFVSGTTQKLTQSNPANPVVFNFIPSITFDARNGLPIDPVKITGGIVTVPADPTWTGYTFAGWLTAQAQRLQTAV
ncbi:MAG: carbohydrate-binding domain-containing protein [Clostridia bacterium]